MVAVTVGQRDPAHRPAGLGGGGEDRVGATADRRVDEREAVLLAKEVGVDEAQRESWMRLSVIGVVRICLLEIETY